MSRQIEAIREAILPILKRNDIKYAALFGSYARNEATPESDIDLLVSFSQPKSLFTLCEIELALSNRLKKKLTWLQNVPLAHTLSHIL